MFHVKLGARDDGVTVAAFALGLRRETAFRDDIVHELALVRRHSGQGRGLCSRLDTFDGLVDQDGQLGDARLPRTADVEDQSREGTGLRLHGDAGEFLQRGDGVGASEQTQVRVFARVDRDVGAAAAGVDLDIAVEIGDVEELLDLVGGDLALFFELAGRRRLVFHDGFGVDVGGQGGVCLGHVTHFLFPVCFLARFLLTG
jgi:hypothetical protein